MKIALGAKKKLGYINGDCEKPAMTDSYFDRWCKVDYMDTNSSKVLAMSKMVAGLYLLDSSSFSNEVVDVRFDSEGTEKIRSL
ncbi:hypothetical protein Scep_029874 [Stephania cephalantha]|uniref:Retrotransposon Copia-like N-terminal domain-containing protein n=1 Tax=Stephania cephalantha TaxID=152367 RepID=A0AAP0E1U5_9MAGN